MFVEEATLLQAKAVKPLWPRPLDDPFHHRLHVHLRPRLHFETRFARQYLVLDKKDFSLTFRNPNQPEIGLPVPHSHSHCLILAFLVAKTFKILFNFIVLNNS
jgi:hypothetical protein